MCFILSHRCRRTQPQTSDGPSLYVGGVDLFALPSNATQYTDFVGSIRNVIIGSTQLDLECPSQEENAILGFHRSSSCENVSLSCIGAHTTGCVDYGPQPYCSCLGGFDPQACQQENSESSFLSSSPLSSSFLLPPLLLPPPFLLPPLLSLPSPSLCLSPCASGDVPVVRLLCVCAANVIMKAMQCCKYVIPVLPMTTRAINGVHHPINLPEWYVRTAD